MSSALPQGIYAKYLQQPYGYPLRIPEPSPTLPESYQDYGLQIGDVGYVDTHGRFQVLFNIRYSSVHELHCKRGVPDQFEPIELDLDEAADFNFNEIPGERVISTGLEQPPRAKDEPRTNYEFLSSSTSGAILILPEGAVRHDLREKDEFRRIAVENAQHWCAFAKRDSLYLITGLYKTASWTLASFDHAPQNGQIIVEQNDTGIYSWDCRFNVDWRRSIGGNDNRNQTVFITGFKIAVRWWAPEPMVELVPRSQSVWSITLVNLRWFMTVLLGVLKLLLLRVLLKSIEHVPQLSEPFHPSDAINRYLLDEDPTARVAVTHDSQWITMLEEEGLAQEDLVHEDRLRAFLSERHTWASDDDVVYLRRKTNAGGSQGPSDTMGGFSIPAASHHQSQIAVTHLRAEIAGLRRMPIGFYVVVQFEGNSSRTENKSVLVADSIIQWNDEIILPSDPSVALRITVRASFEFDPMLGNGHVLNTQEIKVKDLVGSVHLITFPSIGPGPSCSSLLITFERRSFNRFGSPSSHNSCRNHSTPHWENSSALAHETDLGHEALVRYHVNYDREDLRKAAEHFEQALVLCPLEHPCHAAALSNLAMAKFIVCQFDGIYTALEAPVSLYRQALELRPDGHPDRPVTLLNLAQVLCFRYAKLVYEDALANEVRELANEVNGICSEGTHERRAAELVLQTCARYTAEDNIGREELDVLISELDRASGVPRDGYFDVPQRLINLSVALEQRGDGEGYDARACIDKAISLNKEALHLIGDDNPLRVGFLSDLANSFYNRFCLYHDLGDLGKGINSWRKTLDLYPLGHQDRAESLAYLARCLHTRFSKLGMLTDLEEAIGLLQAELNLPHTHAPTPVWLFEDLSHLLQNRFLRMKTVVDLDEAIALRRASLEFPRPTDSSPSHCPNALALLLSTRFDLCGEVTDLDEAVRVSRDHFERYPQGHRVRSSALDNLADTLRGRFERLGAMDDLNETITMQEELWELDHFQQYRCTVFWRPVVRCLLLRFNHLKTITDLDAAIGLSRVALELYSPIYPCRDSPVFYLAACLVIRFENVGTISSLNDSIALHRQIMKQFTGYDVSSSTSALAECLSIRFRHLNLTTDLDEAIALHRVLLDKLEPDAPYQTTSLGNLAACLRMRFEVQGMITDVDEAITLYRTALQLHRPDHPDRILCLGGLARSLTSRFHQSKECNDTEEAFHHYTMLSGVSLGVAVDLEGAEAWVNAAEEFGHETRVLAYQTCLRFLIHRLVAFSSSSNHPPILEDLAESLAVDAFSACLRDGRFSIAVELLEQGRDIFWSALLRLRSPLDEVIASGENGEMLAQSFMQLASLVRSLPDVFDTLADQYDRPWKLGSRLQTIMSDIRMLPGLSRFLEPLLFSDLQKAASHGAVVIVNASQYSCDALIVLDERDPVHVPLKPTKAHIAELASRLRSLPSISETKDRTEAVILVLRELWSLVVSPIVDVLQMFQPLPSRIWWYPTAEFSFLPLHAAGPYEEGKLNFTDLYISSYTPTLTELIRARRISLSYSTTHQPPFVVVDTAPDVAEEPEDRRSAERKLAPLTQRIARLASTTYVKGKDSTVARVTEELGKNVFVHVDCPAIANPEWPFESSFVLSDGHLKMEDIMRLDMQEAQFAFLSASGLGDEAEESSGSSCEMFHIVAAMQCAGFSSVVGPMWAVDPEVAKVMAARFYENMVGDKSKRLDHTGAALALHRTITSCRETPFDQRIMWLHMGI